MKRCRDCGKLKALDQFSLHSNTKDGRRPECKSCGVENANRNREKIRKMWEDGKLHLPKSKFCPRCKMEKSADEFSVNRFLRCGLDSFCRECSAARHRLMRENDPKKYLWKSAKSRAKANDIKFTITIDDIPNIPEICPALGIRLEKVPGKTGFQKSLATLDRKIPKLGYTPGNVVVVSWLANQIKSSATPDQIVSLARFYGNLK